jgi:hypothetical protein
MSKGMRKKKKVDKAWGWEERDRELQKERNKGEKTEREKGQKSGREEGGSRDIEEGNEAGVLNLFRVADH